MKESEITALAREYAEEYTKKKYPNVPGHVRERIVEGRLEHMEDFIPWLLRRYCLVEKEAVRKEYESVKDTTDDGEVCIDCLESEKFYQETMRGI